MALLVWGLLVFSGVYWLIQLLSKPLSTPGQAAVAAERHGGRADMTRLFGASTGVAAPQPEAVAESRFKLLGVVAPRNARDQRAGEGVALIAVDGVARTVRVGARLDMDKELRLLAVEARSVSLGQGGVVSLTLQMAPPSPATTGALPPAAPSPVVLGGNYQPGTPLMPQGAVPQAPMQQQLPQAPVSNDVSAPGQQSR